MTSLTRSIGVQGLTASLFNTIVGAGIFAMPAVVAQMLGASAVYAYAACAVAMLTIVLAFGVAGSRVPRAGGAYAYSEAAFGPFVGFLAGVMVWLSDLLASSAVLAGLVAAVGQYAPAVGTPVGRALFLVVLLGTLAGINMRGVHHGTRVVQGITIAKVAPLLVLIAAAVISAGPQIWQVGPLPDASTIGRATLVLIFAFAGAESAMSLSGEVANPSRTIPRALVMALALIALLYVSVHLSAATALGPALPATTDATLAAAAGSLMGPTGRSLLLAGTVISMLGYTSALVMATPRLVYAIASRGLLPAGLAYVHPRWQTPTTAIAVQTTLLLVVALSGSFGVLAAFASVAAVSVYLLACIAALHLQRRDIVADEARPAGGTPTFRVPVPVLGAGIVVCFALLTQATRTELAVEAGVLAVASIWYGVGRLGRPAGAASDVSAARVPGAEV